MFCGLVVQSFQTAPSQMAQGGISCQGEDWQNVPWNYAHYFNVIVINKDIFSLCSYSSGKEEKI